MTLQELGKKYKTDKCGHYHSGKTYLEIYDRYKIKKKKREYEKKKIEQLTKIKLN